MRNIFMLRTCFLPFDDAQAVLFALRRCSGRACSPSTMLRTCFLLFTFSFLLFTFSAFPAWSATYYVAKNGSDWNSCARAQSKSTPKSTIGSGLGCLARGDTLVIKGGTYTEAINIRTIPSGLSNTQRTVIKGAAGETVIIKPSRGNNIGDAVTIQDRSYITLDNLTIDGANVGLYVVRIRGYAPSYSHFITIQNSTIRNGVGRGYPSSGVGTCIIQQGPAGTSTNLVYRNLHIHNCGLNSATPRHAHGIYLFGKDSLVEGNEIHDIGGFGIKNGRSGADNLNNNILRYNEIHNARAGIQVANGANITVHDNIVYNNDNGEDFVAGIWSIAAVNPKIYNNTIYSNRGYCVWLRSSVSGADVRNNICWQNRGNAIRNDTYGGGTISHNLLADPLFKDPKNNDFRPLPGSPAIDAGATITELTRDFAGVSRPQGAGYDIGGYEYKDKQFTPASPSNLDVRGQ